MSIAGRFVVGIVVESPLIFAEIGFETQPFALETQPSAPVEDLLRKNPCFRMDLTANDPLNPH